MTEQYPVFMVCRDRVTPLNFSPTPLQTGTTFEDPLVTEDSKPPVASAAWTTGPVDDR
jgi:hypothetical protein